jgi:hypothetical protein
LEYGDKLVIIPQSMGLKGTLKTIFVPFYCIAAMNEVTFGSRKNWVKSRPQGYFWKCGVSNLFISLVDTHRDLPNPIFWALILLLFLRFSIFQCLLILTKNMFSFLQVFINNLSIHKVGLIILITHEVDLEQPEVGHR